MIMIKNRTAQLIFQTVYCVLAVIGIFSSTGYFVADFNSDFYVYYTNLSNYICAAVMFITLINTAKCANKGESGYCTTAPAFNFMCVIMIMFTFLVYNILLSGDSTVVQYFTSLNNMLLHVILPIMFILNFALFYERKSIKWFYPFLSMVMPLIYVVFIVIRAAILKGATNTVLYPYFFLNIDDLGWGGFFVWVSVLLVIFIVIGYVLFALDNFKTIKNRLTQKEK